MNCSARMVGVACWLLASLPAAAVTTAEFDDATARLQFAYYTADTRSVEEMVALIGGFEVEAKLAAAKSYQLAYGNWKLAQLYGDPKDERARSSNRSSAGKAAKACVRFARETITQDPRMAEIYAIEAVCDGFSPGQTQSNACSRSKSLKTALTLGTENPRVQFIDALCALPEGDPSALSRWQTVVAKFEAAPPSQPGKPDWGHPEALTLLGESYLKRGDMVAARDVLERALVLAPDYRQAQKLLQTAATRPR